MPVGIIALGGLEAQIPTMEDLTGALHAHTQNLTSAIHKARSLPLFSDRSASAVAIAGTPTVLVLGNAPAGKKWSILAYTVLGGDDHTSPGASAALYIGDAFNAYGGLPPLSQAVVPGIAVPLFENFNRGTIWASSSESVFVVIYGAASGQNLVANVRFAEWAESAVSAQTL